MEFVHTIGNQIYHFSFLKHNSVLVSAKDAEYILYKTNSWHCADEIKPQLLQQFAEVIDEHMLIGR